MSVAHFRPFLYATTRDFLMHFGLKGLSELPPLAEFEETFGGNDELVESRPAAPIAVEHEAI